MKKIALIGTHGVGKTTTAYGIGYRLKQLRHETDVLYEGARKCPLLLPSCKKSTVDTQKWILGEQLKLESIINPNIDFAICDRSVLDVYVYSLVSNRRFARSILSLIVEHMKTYDYIFYLPIRNKYLKSDSMRSGDKQFQTNIDILMQEVIKFLRSQGIKIISMENDNTTVDRIVGIILFSEGFIK